MKKVFKQYIILLIGCLILLNFFLAPKSVIAYNNKNLNKMKIVANRDMVKVSNEIRP